MRWGSNSWPQRDRMRRTPSSRALARVRPSSRLSSSRVCHRSKVTAVISGKTGTLYIGIGLRVCWDGGRGTGPGAGAGSPRSILHDSGGIWRGRGGLEQVSGDLQDFVALGVG